MTRIRGMKSEERIEQARNLVPLRWTAMLIADRNEVLMLKNVLQQSVDDNRLQRWRNDEKGD